MNRSYLRRSTTWIQVIKIILSISDNAGSFRAKPWAVRRVLWHRGMFQPSSAKKGMHGSLKIRKRTSCPGEMPGCRSALNEGLFSLSATSTGKVLCFLLQPITQNQPRSLVFSTVYFWCTYDHRWEVTRHNSSTVFQCAVHSFRYFFHHIFLMTFEA